MLLLRVVQFLVPEHLQVSAESCASGTGLDDVVDKTPSCRAHRVRKVLFIVCCLFFNVLVAKDDFYRPLCSHNSDLGSVPGVVHVPAQVLGGHNIVGASVGFAGDDCQFGDSAFGVGVQQFGSVPDDPAVLLGRSGQEARHIDKGDDRDVETVAEPHKPGCFDRCVNVQAASQLFGLVGYNSDGPAFHACKTNQDIFSEVGHDFEEVRIVHHTLQHIPHVVGRVGVCRDQLVQNRVLPVHGVCGDAARGLLFVGERDKVEKGPHSSQCLHLVIQGEVRYS
mmetsp:Transcript_29814/g.58374  ORF Transcript_29814/g.58374 Transcript_29814/m.58374 type:complete len:280 (-) Transcript_29814:818-1657(-)